MIKCSILPAKQLKLFTTMSSLLRHTLSLDILPPNTFSHSSVPLLILLSKLEIESQFLIIYLRKFRIWMGIY